MNKSIQFSEKATYASPSCKTVVLDMQGIVCQSYGELGRAGAQGGWIEDEGEDY